MDDIVGRQPVGSADSCLARRAAADLPALLQQSRAYGMVYRSVNSTAAEQEVVCGIDDGIHAQGGNISHGPRPTGSSLS